MMSKIDQQRSLVIDITYQCNCTCRYCRWGSGDESEWEGCYLEKILVPGKQLEAISVNRVVLSGGEPLLHPEIELIIEYYSCLVDDVVLITNGLLASPECLINLERHGLTGLAFSIDSLNKYDLKLTRDMSTRQVDVVLSNLRLIAQIVGRENSGLEIGINAVVSSPTVKLETVRQLIESAMEMKLAYVKFQPIFDDGYTRRNAPDLMLDASHTEELGRIAEWIQFNKCPIPTNPAYFWLTVSATLNGARLDGASCGLRDRGALLYRNQYHFCAWLNEPILGTMEQMDDLTVSAARSSFIATSANCDTGSHCYCLQAMNHRWRLLNE